MKLQTERPWTQARVLKEDLPLLAKLGDALGEREKARFNSEHVIHRAITALEASLKQ